MSHRRGVWSHADAGRGDRNTGHRPVATARPGRRARGASGEAPRRRHVAPVPAGSRASRRPRLLSVPPEICPVGRRDGTTNKR
ncbi:MAG: hypothetical protein AVDCRST_MAG49-4122 [uncultured Thermomicrobiales bacterium]|uniref:Uncharacterized protein n=1 Tax=uncultured Thermomicrobiales bacterium TaxID=1645740 RepID=A0A6J4VCJ4_9BACT|nr:MAG: hypothetical protein AVDCRST_MAG49-4122 [uncultured Thermomicrobiales bacterium]